MDVAPGMLRRPSRLCHRRHARRHGAHLGAPAAGGVPYQDEAIQIRRLTHLEHSVHALTLRASGIRQRNTLSARSPPRLTGCKNHRTPISAFLHPGFATPRQVFKQTFWSADCRAPSGGDHCNRCRGSHHVCPKQGCRCPSQWRV